MSRNKACLIKHYDTANPMTAVFYWYLTLYVFSDVKIPPEDGTF